MEQKRYTEEQIIGFLKEHKADAKAQDLVRRREFSERSFYRRKSKFGGTEVSGVKRLRDPSCRLRRKTA